MLTIGHFSDTHGRNIIPVELSVVPDAWFHSGDFFPNRSRGNVEIEVDFQREWFIGFYEEFVKRLHGKPLFYTPGNHDYVELCDMMPGYPVTRVTTAGVDFMGERIAGFREIPYIAGEWNGEVRTKEFAGLVYDLVDSNPTIIMNHAPCAGILDMDAENLSRGITAMSSAITYGQFPDLKAYLCGHVHDQGGKRMNVMGVDFYNSAETLQIITV